MCLVGAGEDRQLLQMIPGPSLNDCVLECHAQRTQQEICSGWEMLNLSEEEV